MRNIADTGEELQVRVLERRPTFWKAELRVLLNPSCNLCDCVVQKEEFYLLSRGSDKEASSKHVLKHTIVQY